MLAPRISEVDPHINKWFMMAIEGKAAPRRTGYCAVNCCGHGSELEALEHFRQYQLDREAFLWLDRRAPPQCCEICGESTTLRARLGHKTILYVLCRQHQSTSSLEMLSRQRQVALLARQA